MGCHRLAKKVRPPRDELVVLQHSVVVVAKISYDLVSSAFSLAWGKRMLVSWPEKGFD